MVVVVVVVVVRVMMMIIILPDWLVMIDFFPHVPKQTTNFTDDYNKLVLFILFSEVTFHFQNSLCYAEKLLI